MIAQRSIDTNILVRYLVRDDEPQFGQVRRLFDEVHESGERLFVPVTVMLELVWVLQKCYEIDRDAVLGALEAISDTDVLELEDAASVTAWIALARESKADIADLWHGVRAQRSTGKPMLMLDRKAVKAGRGVFLAP